MYKRKIIIDSTLMTLFDSLVGLNPTPSKDNKYDDLKTEGCCILLNKVGYLMEEKLREKHKTKKGGKAKNKVSNFLTIEHYPILM